MGSRSLSGKLEHLADRIDQKAERFAAHSMPIAIGGLAVFARDPRSSRLRRWIAVTMRPRRLSTPAISGPASGTRVMRDGLKTSCTRSIGRPNNWPAVGEGDIFGRAWWCRSSRSRCPIDIGALFLDRRDQPGAVELGDEIVEADGAAALDRLGGDHGGERDDGNCRRCRAWPRIASANANPSMSGISMSVTTRSKRVPDFSAASASAAEPTATT